MSRSRVRGGGIGAQVAVKPLVFRGVAPSQLATFAPSGDAIFAPTAAPSCPPGFHWEDDSAPTTLKGIAACVPNAAATPTQATAPLVPTAAPAPAGVPSTTTTCPPVWPWWWLLVAAAAGGAAGYFTQKNQKKVKRNAGRIAGAAGARMLNRASDVALARLVG